MFTGMLLLDLQKDFCTVDHKILCDKLEAIGILSVYWFKSYLVNRKQFVHINNVSSDAGIVTCGVPQGNILEPLLFLIYVNAMQISFNSKCKASVTIVADFSPEFNPPFRWRSKHQTKKWLFIPISYSFLSFQIGPVEVQLALFLYLRNVGYYQETSTVKHGIWIFYPKMTNVLTHSTSKPSLYLFFNIWTTTVQNVIPIYQQIEI